MDQPTTPPIDRRAIPPQAQESHWHAPDGFALRRIDWPAGNPPRGSILFLPGRGDFYEKYLETFAQWHRAGWGVTAADWRGQGGSGRLGDDAVIGHVGDFAHWVEDLAALWRDWQAATPGPHILAAHSMGGHIVMRALVAGALDPDAVVIVAPMLNMAGPPLPLPLLHGAAKLMCAIGKPQRAAWKWSEKPGEIPAARRDLLSHDAARYADEAWWREKRPELVMGPGSWGWVERAYASIRVLEARGALEGVQTPVLILSTANDKLVRHAAAVRAAERLPHGELIAFGKEAHHEILREVDPVRNRALMAIAEFLDRVAPQRTR